MQWILQTLGLAEIRKLFLRCDLLQVKEELCSNHFSSVVWLLKTHSSGINTQNLSLLLNPENFTLNVLALQTFPAAHPPNVR